MINRIKTLFFIFILSFSVVSGAPLGDMSAKENVCPMKCCKEAAKAKKPVNPDAKYLCAVLLCSQSSPGKTNSNSQINLTPVVIASEKAALFEFLFSTTPKESSAIASAIPDQTRQILPKYIQHQRILI
ncbi:MAG: hypothetical protein R2681_10325 [Pyrinomonadaceae bacterium]